MESAAQTVERLVGVLEDLAAREGCLFRAGDFPGVVQLQQRMAPVVETLAGLRAAAGAGVHDRIAAVLEARRRSEQWLADARDRGAGELRQMQGNQRRLIQLRPAYRGAALRAAGGGALRAQV